MKEIQYIAYYRVSTKKQGVSGLGLDAQKDVVNNTIRRGVIVHSYTDIESGKKSDRPELIKAINDCKATGATLVIAKLDRLSRNLTFISTLMDSKVKFLCCDMPDANELTIHIFAVLAQWELNRISTRTKEALTQLKKRGVVLGNPNTRTGWHNEHQKLGSVAMKEKSSKNEHTIRAKSFANALYKSNMSITDIVIQLNDAGFKTSTGNKFRWETVNRLINN